MRDRKGCGEELAGIIGSSVAVIVFLAAIAFGVMALVNGVAGYNASAQQARQSAAWARTEERKIEEAAKIEQIRVETEQQVAVQEAKTEREHQQSVDSQRELRNYAITLMAFSSNPSVALTAVSVTSSACTALLVFAIVVLLFGPRITGAVDGILENMFRSHTE